jgi:hypothetical protein
VHGLSVLIHFALKDYGFFADSHTLDATGLGVRIQRGTFDTSWERNNPYVSRASDSSLQCSSPYKEVRAASHTLPW